MTTTLRTLNLGGILDRGVNIFRAQPLLFFGLGLIPGLAELAYQIASVHPKSVTNPDAAHIALVVASYGATFVLWVGQIVLGAIVTAAVCLATSKINLGEAISIRFAFDSFKSKGGRLVWLGFLQGFYAGWPFFIIVFVAAFMAAGVGSSANPLYVMLPIYILGSVPCIALYTRYALAFPACAIENLGAQASIKRSVGLSEGGRWRICGGFLVPLVPPLIVLGGSAALIEYLKAVSPLLAESPLIAASLNGLAALLMGLVFTPFNSIVLTLLYYDQRIRREGYDIERMMDTAGMNSPVTELSEAGPAATEAEEAHA
ncbi:MAG: hypothetical protein ABR956_10770 [Terracidiphilus sp.]|jgi:hypothetical protein